jgi:hypothetical protein
MNSRLHHLDRRIVPNVRRGYSAREGYLREAEGARVGILRGADDLEDGHEGEGHVWWAVVGAAGAEAHVHVEEGCCMSLEPARLEGDGAALDGPGGAVCGCAHAAAWEGMLVELGELADGKG